VTLADAKEKGAGVGACAKTRSLFPLRALRGPDSCVY
jgi:hypothetical protein